MVRKHESIETRVQIQRNHLPYVCIGEVFEEVAHHVETQVACQVPDILVFLSQDLKRRVIYVLVQQSKVKAIVANDAALFKRKLT